MREERVSSTALNQAPVWGINQGCRPTSAPPGSPSAPTIKSAVNHKVGTTQPVLCKRISAVLVEKRKGGWKEEGREGKPPETEGLLGELILLVCIFLILKALNHGPPSSTSDEES